jgi:hypothetical protein
MLNPNSCREGGFVMLRMLPLLTAIPLLLAAALVEGRWTNRWVVSEDLRHAAEQLRKVPLSFRDWQGQDIEMDARTQEQAGIDGYLMRHYRRTGRGDTVTVLFVCGRPGHIGAHTPDVCYEGAGYNAIGEPTRRTETVAGILNPVKCFTTEFHKPGPLPDPLQIIWTWTGDGEWQAPDNPRVHFVRSPVLYKLYVVTHPGNEAEKEIGWEFLRTFLPEAQKTLFPAS